MITKDLLESALKLPPDERFALIDELLHSLDRPDPEWIASGSRRPSGGWRLTVRGGCRAFRRRTS